MGSRVSRRGLLLSPIGAVSAYAGSRRVLTGHKGAITALSWSSDGARLASAADAREPVCLWRPDVSGARPFKLEGTAFTVAWSPDGRRLALRDREADVVAVWKLPGLTTEVAVNSNAWFSGHPHPVWSPSSGLLALSGDNYDFGVFDVHRKRLLWKWAYGDRTRTLVWSPEGRMLVSAGGNGGLRVFNGLTGELLYTFRRSIKEPYAPIHVGASWSSDGEWLAVSGPQDGTIRLWEMAFRRESRVLELSGYLPNCLAWRPDANQLAVTAGDDVWLFDLDKGKRRKLAGPPSVYTDLAWRPRGKSLAVGKRDGSILLVEVLR